MKNLINKLNLKVTKHLLERMEERGVTEQEIVSTLHKHRMVKAGNPETVKLVGRSVTIVITKTREILTTYRNK